MFKIVVAAAVATVSFASFAYAGDIPATPMNHGPMMVRGMGPVGDLVNVGMTPVNVLAPPAIAVGGAVGGAVTGVAGGPAVEPAAATMPMKHHRHHHMMKHKKMMKKKKMM